MNTDRFKFRAWDKDNKKMFNHEYNNIEAFFVDLHEQKIIGNIFENPELMEGDKK